LESGEGAQPLIGRGDVIAEEAKYVGRLFELIEHHAAIDVLDRVQLELERGEHTEVATSAADGPEEVLVLPLAGGQEASVGRDHVGGDEVVTGEPAAPREVADAPAQGQARDTGGRDDAAGGGEAEGVGGGVQVAPDRTALRPGAFRGGVDTYAPHPHQVDHDGVVPGAEARDAVAA